jgi:hypothetical protein
MPAVEIHPPKDQLIRAQKAGMLIERGPSIPPSGMPLTIHLQQPNAKLSPTIPALRVRASPQFNHLKRAVCLDML